MSEAVEQLVNGITVERDGGIGWIRINRPERLNAFAGTMREEIEAGLLELEADDEIRCVIVTGVGRAFSTGGDIRVMAELAENGDRDRFEELRPDRRADRPDDRRDAHTRHRRDQRSGCRRGRLPGAGVRPPHRERGRVDRFHLRPCRAAPRLGRELLPAAAGRPRPRRGTHLHRRDDRRRTRRAARPLQPRGRGGRPRARRPGARRPDRGRPGRDRRRGQGFDPAEPEPLARRDARARDRDAARSLGSPDFRRG